MTDEELCAALRVSQWDVRQKAADRIEELVQERQAHHANPADFRYWEGRYRDEKANLAKAVEALRAIKDVECIHCTDFFHGLADAVLAEIGGGA